MSADYEGSSSPLMLDDDLSRSMEDAFSFSSVSSSNLPSTSSTPILSHPLGLSRSSSSKSDGGSLLTEHKSTATASTTPQKASQSALKAAQDLESFFADQTPVILTNIPLRHSSTSLLTQKPKSAPPTPTRSPISTLSKREDGSLIYSVTSSDTLEGVSLKFGIKVPDLKKANKLFNSRDFCVRKTLIIPLTEEQYRKYMEELDRLARREDEHRKEVQTLFIEKTKTTPEVADLYLADSHYHITRALDRYQLENSSTSEPLDIRPTTRSTFGPQIPDKKEKKVAVTTTKLLAQADDLFDL